MMRNKKTSAIAIILAVMLLFSAFLMTNIAAAKDAVQEKLDYIGQIIEFIQGGYIEEINLDKLVDGALHGMLQSLDPHSMYFTKAEFEEFYSSVNGSFVGIGIQIDSKDGYVNVIAPIKGTPAERAGIQAGDLIVSVDEKNIFQMKLEEVVSMIRGEAGTSVKIGIKRKNVDDILYFDIVREEIKIDPIHYEFIEGDIGYIQISEFNESTAVKFRIAMDKMKEKNIKGLIIDVRNNPGGYLDQVVAVSKLIIPKGPIVSIDYRTSSDKVFTSTLEKTPYPLVVLVNGGSASASEIFAGAVQDSGAGKIVGTKTYGKGTVQSIYSLINGGGLKLTAARYMTPKGNVVDGAGITPDVVVENEPLEQLAGLSELVPLKGDKLLKFRVSLDTFALQQRLVLLGIDVGTVDGMARTKTIEALKQFQRDNGLSATGTLNEETRKALDTAIAKLSTSIQKDVQLETALEMLGVKPKE